MRLPPSLDERLQQSAKENERSVNAEIVQRLRNSYDGWKLDRVRA